MRGTVGVDVRGVAFVIGGFFRLAGADSERDCKSQTDCDELFHVVVVFDWVVGAEMFSAVRWVQCRAVQNPSRFVFFRSSASMLMRRSTRMSFRSCFCVSANFRMANFSARVSYPA